MRSLHCRPAPVAYVGATSRTPADAGLGLDPDVWAWQPKVDGCYAQIATDRTGRVCSVLSRAGAELPDAADLLGIVAGPPLSVLVGELEAHTEAGIRAATTRGYRLAHLFDCLRFAGRPIGAMPYIDRRAALHHAQAWVESASLARDRSLQIDAQGDAHDARGRYAPAIPRDLRRFPIVPQARGHADARALWQSFVAVGGGEGLVAVRLDAPAGARAAKRKIKSTDTIDALIVSRDARAVRCRWRGLEWVMSCARPYPVGAVIEIAHDGWYESGRGPRFPRAIRQRHDLTAGATVGAAVAVGRSRH